MRSGWRCTRMRYGRASVPVTLISPTRRRSSPSRRNSHCCRRASQDTSREVFLSSSTTVSTCLLQGSILQPINAQLPKQPDNLGKIFLTCAVGKTFEGEMLIRIQNNFKSFVDWFLIPEIVPKIALIQTTTSRVSVKH